MTAYANTAVDVVLKGVEKLLETEFTRTVAVYKSREYERQARGRSIRLTLDGSDMIERSSDSFTRRYNVVVSCYLRAAQRTAMRQEEEINEFASQAQRKLDENATYRISTVYQWHDGRCEEVSNNPELEESEEAEKRLSVVRFVYAVSVTEVGSGL